VFGSEDGRFISDTGLDIDSKDGSKGSQRMIQSMVQRLVQMTV